MNNNYLKFFLSVFLAIAWGGAVRTVIKTFELSIPYTVVLLVTGLLLGLGARINLEFCEKWTQYTRFARAPPELILYIFLPILIFESAFSMKAHVFFRSFLSVSLLYMTQKMFQD
jgi:NhaP-type Na+/H+ or K+/H+ antiporter